MRNFTLFCNQGNSDGLGKIMTKSSPRNQKKLIRFQALVVTPGGVFYLSKIARVREGYILSLNASMVDSARWPCTIQAWADRSIPGTFERSARSLRLRNRVWNISGRLSDLTGDFHPENAAPSTKYGRAELTVEAFE